MAEQQSRDTRKQNPRNKKNTFEHIRIVEDLLNQVQAHMFFMCKNLLDRGMPDTWPVKKESLLDRGNEIYGLGLESSTSTTDSNSEPAKP